VRATSARLASRRGDGVSIDGRPNVGLMLPGEKMAWLLNAALDVKRDILTMPLPDPDDDSQRLLRGYFVTGRPSDIAGGWLSISKDAGQRPRQ
jgi:hypothetical protein